MKKIILSLAISLLLPLTAFAAPGAVKILPEVVNEGSTVYASVAFFDENKDPVNPESVYYMVSTSNNNEIVAQGATCTSEAQPSTCSKTSECDSGSCVDSGFYRCNDTDCQIRYFCRNNLEALPGQSECTMRCESGTPTPPASCDADSDCTDDAACTGANCDCIGTPDSQMNLTLMPIANKIIATGPLRQENRLVVVLFTYPSGCSGTSCNWGSGQAVYRVQDLVPICVVTTTSKDGTQSTTCP